MEGCQKNILEYSPSFNGNYKKVMPTNHRGQSDIVIHQFISEIKYILSKGFFTTLQMLDEAEIAYFDVAPKAKTNERERKKSFKTSTPSML
jgi:hypothetical protein